ncbi:MAG: PTS transporter subunit EIIC [Eubacterium sp.]|nr:PTS transporter subunit EIIC [Eubacterium sp.]
MNTNIIAHNVGMRFFYSINKLQGASLFPFIFCSVFLVIAELLQLIGSTVSADNEIIFYNFSKLLYDLMGYAFCYFIVYRLTYKKSAFSAFWGVLCLAVFYTAMNSLYESSSVYFVGIIMALFCVFCFNKLDKVLAMSLTMISSILFGVLLGFLLDYWDNFVMWLSQLISGKGYFSPVLFSVADNIFSLFGIDSLKYMIFYKSYGGAIIYEGEIVTGVKDLFSAGYTGQLVSSYLSGHYFLIFALVGVSTALFSNLKGIQKYILVIVTVSAVISGDISILLLFLFFESPFIFAAVLLMGALAYLAAYILDLGIGYVFSGGIIELIMYIDKAVYLLAGGVVFVAIGYFVYKFCYEKHGISDCLNIYIPTRLNNFVKALGGINNIVRYKNDALEVRNPKLIDTVTIECEINENIIKSSDKRFLELKEYL